MMLVLVLRRAALFVPGGSGLWASGLMLAAVLSWSLFPLAFSLGGGGGSPLLSGGLWRLGVSLSGISILLLFFRPLLRDLAVLRLTLGRLRSWSVVPVVLNGFQLSVFFLASRIVDVSVVTVLTGLVPVVFVLLMYRLVSGRYRRNLRSMSPFLAFAFLGSVLVVAGEAGGFSLGSAWGWPLALGVFLSMLSVLTGAAEAWTFRWGVGLAEQFPPGYDPVRVVLFGSMLVYAVMGLPGTLAVCLGGLVLGERLPWDQVVYAVFCGVFLQGVGNFLFRKANLITDNLGVNSLCYLTPVLSLGALALFGLVGVASPVYLVAGGLVVVGANLGFVVLERWRGS